MFTFRIYEHYETLFGNKLKVSHKNMGLKTTVTTLLMRANAVMLAQQNL